MRLMVEARDRTTGKLVKMTSAVDVGVIWELWSLEGYQVRAYPSQFN